MNREKKGIIIVSICIIVLFSMFLIQLPNEEIKVIQSVNDDPTPVIYNEIISTNAHMNTNVSYSDVIFINATYGYGGNGGHSNFIPIQNVSYSPVNTTFYVVAGGGGAGYYPHMETK